MLVVHQVVVSPSDYEHQWATTLELVPREPFPLHMSRNTECRAVAKAQRVARKFQFGDPCLHLSPQKFCQRLGNARLDIADGVILEKVF